jgi:hypothetical protein
MSLLHVVNGESTLGTLRESGVPGEMHSWFDMLMEGPLPDGSEAGWQRRAAALAATYGLDAGQFLEARRAWEERLAGAGAYEEAVLWFEGDLFCGCNLAYLLHWFASHPAVGARLSLVCPLEERLGTFKGERLAQAFQGRVAVDGDLLDHGRLVWEALVGAKRAVAAALRVPSPAAAGEGMLALRRVLELQEERADGAIERELLGLAASPVGAAALFKAFYQTELGRGLGMGDAQFWALLVDMRRRGLLVLDPEPGPPPYDGFPTRVEVRAKGREAA